MLPRMSVEIDAASVITELSRKPKHGDDTQTDSGYATQSASPDSKSTELFPRESTAAENKARPISQALPPLTDLAEFDKPVDDNTLSRFRHVHTQIEKPLLDYMRRKLFGSKYRPIALRLMILGRNKDDATPCIVAFCPGEQCKRVRRFFDKSSVRALCQPEDEALPSFDVFVLGRALEAKHADDDVEILIPMIGGRQGYTDETYCGQPIIIHCPSAPDRRCTFGGIIKAAWWNGDTKLYGLTVGHVLLGDSDDDQTEVNTCQLQFSDSESEDEPDELAEQELEDPSGSLPAMENPQPGSGGNHDTSASWASSKMLKIGCISPDSLLTQIEGGDRYHDWALIEMERYRPNRIRQRKLSNGEVQGDNVRSGDLSMPITPPCRNGKRQSVTLLSGSEGLKRGHLSPLPSRLLLGTGKAFVDTLILNLNDDQQIQDGDSGSWVVNENTLEVYGYVVAADCFGGGHVIPLSEAFGSIRDSLGLCSVNLATTVDMATTKLDGDHSTANERLSPNQATEQQRDNYWPRPALANDEMFTALSSGPSGREYRPDSGYSSGIHSTSISPNMHIPPLSTHVSEPVVRVDGSSWVNNYSNEERESRDIRVLYYSASPAPIDGITKPEDRK